VAVACALVAGLVPWEVVRLLAALPLVFLLPGYAFAAATSGPLRGDLAQRVLLILLCGLAILCLGGLVLNFMPGGIRTFSWALLLVLVVLVAARVAAVRRPAAEPERPAWRLPRPRAVDLVVGGLALAIVAGALVLAYTPLPAPRAAGFTSLWMLPSRPATGSGVKVGVVNSEQQAELYRLVVRPETAAPVAFALALAPGERRTFHVPVAVKSREPTRVGAVLSRKSHPGVAYRHVVVWLQPGAGGE
jgi:uncharacterized membrane protein